MEAENLNPWGDVHVVPLPIPKIGLEPFFSPDSNMESFSPDRTVPELLEWLWGEIASIEWLDRSDELDDCTYWLGEVAVEEPWRDLCGLQIAAAKSKFFEEMMASLLANDFWAKKRTEPSVSIMKELTKHRLYWIAKIANQNCRVLIEDAWTIGAVESGVLDVRELGDDETESTKALKERLSEFVRIVEPTVELFFASLRANNLLDAPEDRPKRKPRPRPTAQRNSEFLRLHETGLDDSAIAQKWNSQHNDTVSKETVRQSISRERKRVSGEKPNP
ncbi:hypothetical protein [Schlesneria paludicola]|uniref:hypothetical protein n=1 Tax=Schlesneria paludicola TaxID=360056 RepID=UPI00029ACAA6|nr:hypothetical protein [Schlesneria paludicola]